MLYMSKFFVGATLGFALLRQQKTPSWGRVFIAMTLGLLLIYAVTALPGIGIPVWLIVTFLGMGALAVSLAGLEGPKENSNVWKKQESNSPTQEGNA